jgi:hypothetical protein
LHDLLHPVVEGPEAILQGFALDPTGFRVVAPAASSASSAVVGEM